MDLSAYKAISINGIPMKKILIGGVVAWIRPIINWIGRSINADGTIYNGVGYKNGYRVRSGGAEAAIDNASCSGYMKVNPGDVIRVSGFDFSYLSTSNAINASDVSFTNLGQLTASYADSGYGIFAHSAAWFSHSWHSVVEEKTGVWKWIVPPAESGVAYIRLTGYTHGDGSKMVLTINEEIT